jgi:hypothetical protein
MDAVPACAALRAGPLMSETVVADVNRGLRWALVYVKAGAGPSAAALPPAVLTQEGCHYEPHVLGLQVGQPLLIRNKDPLLHNVHALPFVNREFNFGQPTSGLEEVRRFTLPEVPVKVKCDVHPWMSAWLGVFDHPFFAVTDAGGVYELPELPAGRYTVEVWHEAYQSVSRDVDVPDDGGVTLNFQLDVRK